MNGNRKPLAPGSAEGPINITHPNHTPRVVPIASRRRPDAGRSRGHGGRAIVIQFRPQGRLEETAPRGVLVAAIQDARRHAEVADGPAWLISAGQSIRQALNAYTWPPGIRARLHAAAHSLSRLDAPAALCALDALSRDIPA